MSVLIETSIGDIVIDLFTDQCPKACLNFLKLCKMKYYNNCLFYDVQKEYVAQIGDITNTGRGGTSIYGILQGDEYRYFDDEINKTLRHNKKGLVSTANLGPNLNNSTFFITLTDKNLTYLNEKHTIFGKIEDGIEIVEKLNKVYVDKENRPFQNIRIYHTVILDDPFDDPAGLIVPSKSPEIIREKEFNRLDEDFKFEEYFKDQETEEKVKEKLQEHEAKNRAIVLEMLEDLPDADIRPPENVLFVCKLNKITQDDDLELIFSRFGPIKSCQIIRDWKTGDSLQYAFIEFETVEACEEAYYKMDGVVIDERRIHVDFSQSVSKLWYNFKKNQNPAKVMEDKNNELILPNENQKFEIKPNNNFMASKGQFKLVFDNPDEDKNYKPFENDKKNNNPHYMKEKNHEKHHKKHRSRSRSHKHSKKRSHEKKRSRSKERKKRH